MAASRSQAAGGSPDDVGSADGSLCRRCGWCALFRPQIALSGRNLAAPPAGAAAAQSAYHALMAAALIGGRRPCQPGRWRRIQVLRARDDHATSGSSASQAPSRPSVTATALR